jgi:uncharacterized protein
MFYVLSITLHGYRKTGTVMPLKERIEADMKQAMLQRNKDELTALRSIKSLILLAQTDKGGVKDLPEEEEMKLLTKAAKQRKESADIFQQQGRTDLAEKELKELEVINRYLPKQLSSEELEVQINNIIHQVGASGPQDMGKVLGIATKTLAGKADGKTISEKVRALLNK